MATSPVPEPHERPTIDGLSVEGFKSIDAATSIDIRPLTILAGANSAGKSSMIQPLLLLKQTLEAPYDPGPLLLNGPNVRFTATTQFLSRSRIGETPSAFAFGIRSEQEQWTEVHFVKSESTSIELARLVLAKHARDQLCAGYCEGRSQSV